MTGMPSPGNGMPDSADGMPETGNGMPHPAGGMPQRTGGMPHRTLTGKPHNPCSHPPKRRGPAYDHRPAAGPGRTSRRARARVTDRQEVRVILPDEPLNLTPAAARVLLRILLKARARTSEYERRESP
jgi:hypothetical protein